MLRHTTLGEMYLSLNDVISPDGVVTFYNVVMSFFAVMLPQNWSLD